MSLDDESAADPGTAPPVVRGMLAGMRAAGVDVEAMGLPAGLSDAALAERKDLIPLDQVVLIWRLGVRQFGRGTLGIHVGAGMPSSTLLEYVAGESPNLQTSLLQISRYIGLASRNIRWTLRPREPDGLTSFEEQLTYAPDAILPALREFGVALTASRVRQWFDRPPREVWFTHPSQGPSDEYARVFGCPVRFERDRVALRYDDEALATPARKHDPMLFRLLES
ncbi:MAG TPA: AraC family transcriptional regulator ligand-binding domain-containing protein, partial [Polyangia bacterium]